MFILETAVEGTVQSSPLGVGYGLSCQNCLDLSHEVSALEVLFASVEVTQ